MRHSILFALAAFYLATNVYAKCPSVTDMSLLMNSTNMRLRVSEEKRAEMEEGHKEALDKFFSKYPNIARTSSFAKNFFMMRVQTMQGDARKLKLTKFFLPSDIDALLKNEDTMQLELNLQEQSDGSGTDDCSYYAKIDGKDVLVISFQQSKQ